MCKLCDSSIHQVTTILGNHLLRLVNQLEYKNNHYISKMNFQYCFYIVMILTNNNTVYCDQNGRVFSINDQVTSCSGWLSTIIFNFCNNTYKIVKRDTSLMIEKMAPKDLQQDTAKRRLLAEGRWRRVRRQVATECCLRPCTVADIIMYCPDDAKLLQEHPEIFE